MAKDDDEGIRGMGNVIKGILSSLEQWGERKARRRRRKRSPEEEEIGAGTIARKEVAMNKGSHPKRKVVPPAEILSMREAVQGRAKRRGGQRRI